MSTYATVTVVDTRDPVGGREIRKIEAALDADPQVTLFKIQRDDQVDADGRPVKGRLCISIDVSAVNLYRAGAAGLLCIERALAAIGFNKAANVVESSVVPVVGAEFTRPRGLRQLGYNAL